MSDRDLFSLSEEEEGAEGEGEAVAAVLAACGQEEEVEHGTVLQRKCSECKRVYVEVRQNS